MIRAIHYIQVVMMPFTDVFQERVKDHTRNMHVKHDARCKYGRGTGTSVHVSSWYTSLTTSTSWQSKASSNGVLAAHNTTDNCWRDQGERIETQESRTSFVKCEACALAVWAEDEGQTSFCCFLTTAKRGGNNGTGEHTTNKSKQASNATQLRERETPPTTQATDTNSDRHH